MKSRLRGEKSFGFTNQQLVGDLLEQKSKFPGIVGEWGVFVVTNEWCIIIVSVLNTVS